MKPQPFRRRALALTAGAALFVLGACSTGTTASNGAETNGTSVEPPAVTAEESVEGLRILLTNDDSMQASRDNNSDGLGLYEMRRALCGAGADVVILGPWGVQSGRGTAVTNSGQVTLAEPLAFPAGYEDDCADAPSGGAVFGLCLGDECTAESASATPVDTIKFAMRGGLETAVGWEGRPDLVVSGPNAGLNVASSVNDSGTIGAAIAAAEHWVPALAVSTSADETLGFFPVENYQATAAWTVEFLQGLLGRELLDRHDVVLSVNYPDVSAGQTPGEATFVEVGTSAFAFHNYPNAGGNTFDIALRLCEGIDLCEESRENADWVAAFENGSITVGAINPDRTYGAELHALDWLASIQAHVEANAPAPVAPVPAS